MDLQLYSLQLANKSFEEKILNLKELKQKIKVISKKLNIQSIERINKVAYLPVQIKHTSQITVNLGCGYLVQIKAQYAIQMIDRKILYYESKIKKSKQIQSKLSKSVQDTNKQSIFKQKTGIQIIGKQNGQDIVNIIEVQNDEEFMTEIKDDTQNDQQQQTKDIMQEIQKQHEKKLLEQHLKETKAQQQLKNIYKQIEPPKKISKFKSQMMKKKN